MIRLGLVFGLWLLAMFFAIAIGTIGRFIVELVFGEYPSHVYKSVLGVAFVLFISWLHARATRGRGAQRAAWAAGLIWLALTVAFEFLATSHPSPAVAFSQEQSSTGVCKKREKRISRMSQIGPLDMIFVTVCPQPLLAPQPVFEKVYVSSGLKE